MKQFYILIALITLTLTASAAPRPVNIVQTANGDWSDKYAWSLGRVPKAGDSIIIPLGSTIYFDKNDSYSNLYITIMGTLVMEKKMTLTQGSGESVISILAGGEINAAGVNRNAEVIKLDGKNKFDENAPSKIFGVAKANGSTGTSPNGFTTSGILPVTYSSFYVIKNANNVVINWSTSKELNNNSFEVQRSFDGSNWEVIGIVLGAGTATDATSYSYTDKNMTTTVAYYRLRQVDMDGNFSYSDVKSIHGNATNPVSKVYAANKNINVEFNTESKNTITVRLFNTNGQMVAQQNYEHASRITMNANNTNTGIYVVQVTDGTSMTSSTKVIL